MLCYIAHTFQLMLKIVAYTQNFEIQEVTSSITSESSDYNGQCQLPQIGIRFVNCKHLTAVTTWVNNKSK